MAFYLLIDGFLRFLWHWGDMKNTLMHKILISLLLLITLPFAPMTAHASAKPKEGAMSNPLSVEIPGIVVPIVNGKRLVNYCFMTIVVHGADDRSASALRANQFLVKDAISRATSKNPIPVLPQASLFDSQSFARNMMPVVAGAVGGVRITKIEVVTPQMMKR